MVNDPSWKWEMEHPGEVPPNNLKASWAASRNRLFEIIEDLVKWENTTNEHVLAKARTEIRKSWRETCELNREHPQATELFNPDKLPAFHDPFAGGGTLPLEAQRLGLEAHASDLNPVAVLINKAMIEIPPKFAGLSPVNPDARDECNLITRTWKRAEGLAEDVRYYGRWMRDEAQKRIGKLYPPVEITEDTAKNRSDLKVLVGQQLTVIAWIWARTVKSPNPAFRHVDVPLASTFLLSSQEGKEAYVDPIINGDTYQFLVKLGAPPAEAQEGTKLGRGNFKCVLSQTPISGSYIKAEAQAGRMCARLMAIVAEGPDGRIYLPPTAEQEDAAHKARPEWKPDVEFFQQGLGFRVGNYGMSKWSDLFTPRQLVTLTTFSDLVQEARQTVERDSLSSVLGAEGAVASSTASRYADALATYLGLTSSKAARFTTTLTTWRADEGKLSRAFARNDIPITWDFAETNPFSGTGGDLDGLAEGTADVLLNVPGSPEGTASQVDARGIWTETPRVISTDPPYYDNIGYADLSDYFYVWLRHSLRSVYPELFATMTVPKEDELVATPARHGGKENAEQFFLSGMTDAMRRLAEHAHPAFPITIYYAFKQSESNAASGTSSTGWETFLEAVKLAKLSVSGTWPVRTEGKTRMRGMSSNALASSIVLVCHPRPATAETTSRRAFLRELNQILPEALDEMTRGSGDGRSPVAPVDLSQAIIGPGMAVFSKYAAVLEADGTPMGVQTALQLINRFLAEDDFDHDTQFCLHWFEQHGWKDGRFGDADTLARAKGTSVDGVKHSGVLFAESGVVRLLKWSDYPADWEPENDKRLPVWEVLHQLIRVFKTDGESGAGHVLAAVQDKAEPTRQLAYRLYTLCERAGWAEDARAYNEIATSWIAIESVAAASPVEKQTGLFD
jgi:putative DNA methylase